MSIRCVSVPRTLISSLLFVLTRISGPFAARSAYGALLNGNGRRRRHISWPWRP